MHGEPLLPEALTENLAAGAVDGKLRIGVAAVRAFEPERDGELAAGVEILFLNGDRHLDAGFRTFTGFVIRSAATGWRGYEIDLPDEALGAIGTHDVDAKDVVLAPVHVHMDKREVTWGVQACDAASAVPPV